jgi:hypothetical protein
MWNNQFENFLKHCAAYEKEKRQTIPNLKVLERNRRALGNYNYNYNNSIRSGSSLSFVSSSVESNPIPLAGERYSSMCENEKQNVRTIIRNLVDTFNSAASSTFA